jgi:hypothetical protein
MQESASLDTDPRDNYKAKPWLGRVYVMDRKTHEVIYSCKRPKSKDGITKSVGPENHMDIFYELSGSDFEQSSFKYFSHGTEILGLEMDDKYAEILQSSGVMESNQYLQHRKNMEEIVKQTKRFDLGSGDTRHMLSFYFDEFILRKESPKKFPRWLRKKIVNHYDGSARNKLMLKYLLLLNKKSV